MAGLYHTLNIGAESLYATRQGVDTAGHNIANAHTEGFSRQRVDLTQREPSEHRGLVLGNGVYVEGITRAHDRFLEKQLNGAGQHLGLTSTKHDAMKAMEGIFSPDLNSSVGDEITNFFQSIQDLANFPEELTVRTNVREAANNMASAFQRVDSSLKEHQANLNARIAGEASEINGMLRQIADLNVSIGSMEVGDSKQACDLRDKQDALLRDLNTRIDINYYRGDSNLLVVRGPSETLLVDKNAASTIAVQPNDANVGMHDLVVISSDGNNITNVTKTNKKGRLAGLIEVRDGIINDMLTRNNELARGVAVAVNDVHRQGFGLKDYKETMGRDFFRISDKVNDAARSIQVSQTVSEDTDAISIAATPNAPGDNVVANEILRIQNAKIMNGNNATLNEFYANTVGVFGLEIVRTDRDKQAQDILMGDLKGRREAVSGVSMDEEAMNLMRWQANFTASSRVITTVDEMIETVLSLKR